MKARLSLPLPVGCREGGIRVNSFISGGFLKLESRGTKYEGLITGWDW